MRDKSDGIIGPDGGRQNALDHQRAGWSRPFLKQFCQSDAAADRHISINPRKAERKSPRYGLEG